MNNVLLIVAMLALGACATSSTPSGGVDGGSPPDATFVDVPAFDISTPSDAGRDVMAPLFDAGPPRVDTGPRDAGPPVRDAGRPDTGPPDGGFCIPDGLYDMVPDPTNPAICDSAGIDMCRVGSAGARVRISCGPLNTACTLEGASCTCSGMTEFSGVIINVFADFDAEQITFSAAGQSCDFTLTSR